MTPRLVPTLESQEQDGAWRAQGKKGGAIARLGPKLPWKNLVHVANSYVFSA